MPTQQYHTEKLAWNSSAELRYASGLYVTNLTHTNLEVDLKPYVYRDSYAITDIGAT